MKEISEEALSRIRDVLQFYADEEHFKDHPNLGKVEFNIHGTWKFGMTAKSLLETFDILKL